MTCIQVHMRDGRCQSKYTTTEGPPITTRLYHLNLRFFMISAIDLHLLVMRLEALQTTYVGQPKINSSTSVCPVQQFTMSGKKAKMSMSIPRKLIQRICVWFCTKQLLTATDTYTRMQGVFRQGCYSRATVFRWHHQFKAGRLKPGDLDRPGQPQTQRTPAKIARCKQLIRHNPRVGLHSLSKTLQVSYGTVHWLVHKDLLLRKRACKSVPHSLTAQQKQDRMDFALEFLDVYGGQFQHRLNWIVTMDESWFFVLDPLSKKENMVWLYKDEDHPQVVKRSMNTAKLMVIPIFD